MARVALALGGNVGDVAAAFLQTLTALRLHPQISLIKLSHIYVTPAWGYEDQPDFLNMAVLIETTLSPHMLLEICHTWERAAGRERVIRWGPRPLDIDIIFYDDLVQKTADLTLPHPEAHERAFVLAPLTDIAPTHRLHGRTIEDWYAAHQALVPDQELTDRVWRGE